MAPTLEALPLRAGGMPTVLLAAGANTALFLSEHGETLDSLELPVCPEPSHWRVPDACGRWAARAFSCSEK